MAEMALTLLDHSGALVVEIQDYLHHAQLLFQRYIGILGMIGVLLQEAHTDYLGGFNDQLLVVRQYIGTDELDDLHQVIFLMEQGGNPLTVCHEVPAHIGAVPAVEGRPTYSL